MESRQLHGACPDHRHHPYQESRGRQHRQPNRIQHLRELVRHGRLIGPGSRPHHSGTGRRQGLQEPALQAPARGISGADLRRLCFAADADRRSGQRRGPGSRQGVSPQGGRRSLSHSRNGRHRVLFQKVETTSRIPLERGWRGFTMAAEPIVRVRGVHKFFTRGSEQIDVLNDLNLEVANGEFLALMGPSGSGKTTLLNLIAGLDKPSQGDVWVGGQLISGMTEGQLARWRTRHVGFIFQFYHLLPVLTAYENVELPLLLLPLSAAQRRQQVTMALDLVGLSDRLKHRPGQLSGGQQQRVGIARAIVTDALLIVADEPTGDLDARSAAEILNLLTELQKSLRKTILLVTHDPRAASRAQRVLHLEKGQLVEKGTRSTTEPIGAADGRDGQTAITEMPRTAVKS